MEKKYKKEKKKNNKDDTDDEDDVDDIEEHGGDVGGGDGGEDGVAVVHGTNVAALSSCTKGGTARKSHSGKGVVEKYSATGKVPGRKLDVLLGDGVVEESCVAGKVHLGKGVVEKSSVCEKVHPGDVVVKKSSVAGKEINSATGKVPGSIQSRDHPSISPGGLANLNDPKVRNFLFALSQIMSQMSPASPDILVAGGTEREEKVDDKEEKVIEDVEVEAVDLCLSEDKKMKK